MNELTTNGVKNAHTIIQKALQQNRYELLEPEAMELIGAFGMTTPRYMVATSVTDAIHASAAIGFPVVLKVVSPDISHKTDVGGVKIGITDNAGVKDAYEGIIRTVRIKRPDARIYGILVAEMSLPSTEVIVGGLRDPQFGPAVMFGLGGIFVEVFKDVSFRIAPLDEYEALDMVHDVKGYKVLKGFRNSAALDISALVQTILRISDIMVSLKEISEIDLNPVLIYQEGIKAVDARVILRQI